MPAPALDLALNLAALGRHVFPLAGANKRPLPNCPACRSHDGRPAHPIDRCPCLPRGGWCHGVRAATTNPKRITAWWTDQSAALVGIATGPSGLVLIDIDTHDTPPPADPARELLPGIDLTREMNAPRGWDQIDRYCDGRDSLRLLAQLRGGTAPWPTDPAYQPATADTPSGGRHLWYRAPADNLHQAVHPHGLAWQVDIKAGWSYGLAPGTHTPRGDYRHASGDLEYPGAPPPWLAREITRRAAPTPPCPAPANTPPITRVGDTCSANYLRAVIANGAAKFATKTDGRKAALAALAYKTGGFLHWSGLSETEALDLLIAAGTRCGLNHRTAEDVARRSLNNGKARPITPHRP
ncbi:MAG: bifunctional DNA primase/polymerase [Sciscionella sp.]